MASDFNAFKTDVKPASHAGSTVISAEISGRLTLSKKSAYNLSLAAKNLSVMSVRIGESAAGLKVLSLFYDQLAQRALKSTDDICAMARRVSLNTMRRWRCDLLSGSHQRG